MAIKDRQIKDLVEDIQSKLEDLVSEIETLEGIISDKDEEISDLEEQVSKLEPENDELKERVKELEEALAESYLTDSVEEDKWLHDNNGGPETKLSYQLAGYNGMTGDHLKWLSQLPLQHEEPGFFFSHAPVPAEWARNILQKGQPDFSPEELTWTYHPDEKGVARDHGNGVVGVCGHIHQLRKGIRAPRFYDHYIYGDSGCGCSPKAPLCAINVVTRDVIYAWPDPVPKK